MTISRPDAWPLERPDGVSEEAMALLAASEVVDLHLDTFIVHRLTGLDMTKRHGIGPLGGRLFGHLDFPTAVASGLTGGMWSITTNPFRPASSRWRTLQDNIRAYRAQIAAAEGRVRIASNMSDWRQARAAGAHVVLPAIQGGNAVQAAPEGIASLPSGFFTRITLVHLTNAVYGPTSSPFSLGFGKKARLTDSGRTLVEQMNAARIFVDLAHIGEQAFWDVVAHHDKGQPLIVTHTGVEGVRPHWRNLTDDQLRAVADTGGVIGIMFQVDFLRRPGGPRDVDMVLEHLEHVIAVAGEDAVAFGSDYDGAIIPPPDLRDGFAPARLVDAMLRRGWSDTRIQKALGLNFLRSFEALRPGSSAAPLA